MAQPQKRKKFFEIENDFLSEKHEAYAMAIEDLDGRRIKLDMTRKAKGKSVDMVFKISVKDQKAGVEPIKLRLMPYFIKHMLRKRISYIEDSFQAQTQESNIIIKPFLITRKRVSRAVRAELRRSVKEIILEKTQLRDNRSLFKDILTGDFQKELSSKLKKIYPLSLCEIRILEVKGDITNKKELEKIKKEEDIQEISQDLKEADKVETKKEIKRVSKKQKEKKE
ncbi:MAG: hypothetical protein PHU51_05340 [Candidatus Nanoarchaeia archaeon]|nr:hypothetical protein [Candidatus Nanoarchaeia archaeon]